MNDKMKNKGKIISKKYTYFLETNLLKEDKDIEIYVEPKNEFFYSFDKIYLTEIYMNKDYICNIFRVEIKDKESNNSNIELKIILKQNNTEFISKNIIDLKSNNFLGLIKFDYYRGWLGTYKAPEIFNLKIISILNKVLLVNKKIKYNDNIYYEFINYGLYLYNTCTQNKLELYKLLYINTLNCDNYALLNYCLWKII